jgi:hypothetical protein
MRRTKTRCEAKNASADGAHKTETEQKPKKHVFAAEKNFGPAGRKTGFVLFAEIGFLKIVGLIAGSVSMKKAQPRKGKEVFMLFSDKLENRIKETEINAMAGKETAIRALILMMKAFSRTIEMLITDPRTIPGTKEILEGFLDTNLPDGYLVVAETEEKKA